MILGKKIMNFKHELSPSKPLLRSTQSIILGAKQYNVHMGKKISKERWKNWKGQNTQLFPYVPPGLNRSSWFNVWRYKNYIGIFNCFIYAFQTSFGPNSEEFCQKLAWRQNYIIFKIILKKVKILISIFGPIQKITFKLI